MNDTLKNIKNRRSTRIFLPEQIKNEELESIIEAGLYAPSAHNEQPWHFTVVQNKEILDELNIVSKEFGKTFEDKILQNLAHNDKFNIFYNAPTVIIISGEEKSRMAQVDCAAATENMLIAAESLGIGSCWVGFVAFAFRGDKSKEYMAKLSMPEGYKPYYAVALGYKKSNSANAPTRRENTVNYVK